MLCKLISPWCLGSQHQQWHDRCREEEADAQPPPSRPSSRQGCCRLAAVLSLPRARLPRMLPNAMPWPAQSEARWTDMQEARD